MKKLVIQDSINKQKQFNRKQVLTPENRETTQPSNTQQNNTERIQTQEQTVNLEKLKRIINGEKTSIPSQRNIEWKAV